MQTRKFTIEVEVPNNCTEATLDYLSGTIQPLIEQFAQDELKLKDLEFMVELDNTLTTGSER